MTNEPHPESVAGDDAAQVHGGLGVSLSSSAIAVTEQKVTDDSTSLTAAATAVLNPGDLINNRYQVGELISQRGNACRYKGIDLGSGQSTPVPIVIVRQALDTSPKVKLSTSDSQEVDLFGIHLNKSDKADSSFGTSVTFVEAAPVWPSLAWERLLLARTNHLSLPRVVDTFPQDGFDYLIIEVPEGRPFWNAWNDLPISWSNRFQWLIHIAEALDQLHQVGAILDGIRPEIIRVSPTGQAVILDLEDLLPLPVPAGASSRGGFYTAPERGAPDEPADARADLFSFGGMVYALLQGRELSDLDFSVRGVPRSYFDRFPEGHPMLGRLLARTFCREVKCRFPSRDFAEADPTGFQELIEVLSHCERSFDRVCLEIAALTNTGVVRSANEDAVAVLHSAEARLEESDDFAVLMLADGMGGMACGEIASALTIEVVRDFFMRHPPFSGLLLDPSKFPEFTNYTDGAECTPEKHRQRILEALNEANRAVFESSRKNLGHIGMGCTAEVVVIDGKNVVIGHVGDSRSYHLRHGRLTQITHDHTLVSHLLALGQLSEAEAEQHPQRSELQQAIGGRKEVYPDTYTFALEPGDWLLVCTDGLNNQLKNDVIVELIKSSISAQNAARRLVNQTIRTGAIDNVSVIVVRAC